MSLVVPLLVDGVWAALLSAACVILFSAPLQVLPAAAGAGFLARAIRDALLLGGASQAVATFCAAAIVVVATSAMIRRRYSGVSPVVLISGLIPLGAAKSFFEAIVGLVRAPLLTGDDLAAAPAAMMSNLAAVFTITLAVALGVAVGALIAEAGRFILSPENV